LNTASVATTYYLAVSLFDGARNDYSLNITLQQISAANRTRFDFDGDRRADISVYRAGVWYLQGSTNGFSAVQFGVPTDRIAPADYDGDGKTDVAVWCETTPERANFYILQSSNNSFHAVQFGRAGDLPASGDFDGDGRADVAVYRRGATAGAQSYFFYRPSSASGIDFVSLAWGLNGDKPASADYDGDGKQDAAVYRPSNGTWYVLRSSNSQLQAAHFGIASDKIVPADYDGDGRTDFAVYRAGFWYVLQSTAGFSAVDFGVAEDFPVAADYDGDGKADIAVYRPSNGTWYLLRSTAGFTGQQFGINSDLPAPAAFLP
jgi:hypothetical protein